MMARSPQKIFLVLFLQALNAVTSASPLAVRATATSSASTAVFTANPNVGPGGSSFVDSDHFRFYDVPAAQVEAATALLEGAYECFVGDLGWRSTGLSFNADNDNGPFTKTNVYKVATLAGAAGVMQSDATTGMGYLEVLEEYVAVPDVIVHEFGHVLTYHQQSWVDQGNTGAWWETVADWVGDTFATSDLCAAARTKHGVATATDSAAFEPLKTIGDSFQVLVDGTADSGNYYQAWPFFTYITNNPDGFAGLGKDALHQMMVQYAKGSNETPLHALSRVSTNATVAEIVGRYWARMAYVDIGHAQARDSFLAARGQINFANVDAAAGAAGSYRVKAARQPRYMGANIIPLAVAASAGAEVAVEVTSAGAAFTAALAVRDTAANTVRYVALPGGAGSATVASGEEASLVVVNAPAELIEYNGFELSGSAASTGLDYSFTLTGATA